jgi:hypothetical protein
MKLKTLVLVVAILAVLSLAAYYLQRPPAPTGADPRTNHPVFDLTALDKAAKIRLTDQGKTVILARQPDGKWIVPSYFDLAADFSKLSRFIDDLSGAKIQRLVTQNPERLARLGFKDASVALLDSADKPFWTLTLGKDAEGGGRFVCFNDEKKGYQANLALFLDTTPKNWPDTLLIELKPDEIAGIEITFGDDSPVTANRAKKDAAWVAEKAPDGQRIKSDRVTSLLSSFASLRFQDTSDLTDANVEAAHKHNRTVRLTTFDHKTVTVEIGRKPEEKKVIDAPKPEIDGKIAANAGQKSAVANPSSTPSLVGPAAEPVAVEAEAKNQPPAKPVEPKTETIPAGPVFAFITSSDPGAAVNTLMKKRAFQIFDWTFTSLPQKRDELFEPVPAAFPAEKKPGNAAAAEKADAKP